MRRNANEYPHSHKLSSSHVLWKSEMSTSVMRTIVAGDYDHMDCWGRLIYNEQHTRLQVARSEFINTHSCKICDLWKTTYIEKAVKLCVRHYKMAKSQQLLLPLSLSATIVLITAASSAHFHQESYEMLKRARVS